MCNFLCYRKSFEVCSSGIECLLKISTQLQDIESLFILPEMEISQAAPRMALIRSLVYIQGEINKSVDDFAIWRTQLFSSISHCGDGNLFFSLLIYSGLVHISCDPFFLCEAIVWLLEKIRYASNEDF